MLMFALLVIPVGYSSVLFFLGFATVFYLLSYKYTLLVSKKIYKFIKKIINKLSTPRINKIFSKIKYCAKKANLSTIKHKKYEFVNTNIFYDKSELIKINKRDYLIRDIVSTSIVLNNKEIKPAELKKYSDIIKNLEIKVGIKVSKISYKHIKYVDFKTKKIDNKEMINNIKNDYKLLNKIIKDKK